MCDIDFSDILYFDVNGTEEYPANSTIILDKIGSHNITCIGDANPQATCDIANPPCIIKSGGGSLSCSYEVSWQLVKFPREPCDLACTVKNVLDSSSTQSVLLKFT